MKTLIAIAMLSSFAIADCPKGFAPHEGYCAADPEPVKAPEINYASDEKPRREQQPAWETGEITADMPQSQAAADAKMDVEKMKADAQGKKSAGIIHVNPNPELQ